MSLILDALRRADAQRERQGPPGLHAHAVSLPGDDPDVAPRRRRLLAWTGAGLLLAALVAWGVGWRPGAPPAPPPSALAAATASTPGAAAGPLPSPVPGPAASPREVTRVAAPAIEPPPRPGVIRASGPPTGAAGIRRPPAEAADTPGASQSAPDPSQETLSREQRLQPQPAAPGAPPAPAAAASAPAPAPPPAVARPQVPPGPATAPPGPARAAASALPPGAPPVSVSGGVYSRNRAQRMVIVNGQVHGEGAQPVEGVTIEQIEADRAVLGWRGQRYTVPY